MYGEREPCCWPQGNDPSLDQAPARVFRRHWTRYEPRTAAQASVGRQCVSDHADHLSTGLNLLFAAGGTSIAPTSSSKPFTTAARQKCETFALQVSLSA
jgi:hypothetical protein